MNWSASWRNSSRTTATSLRVTCFRLAIAAPTCCTSRALRYLNTSAAASSPSDIIRTALRVMPSIGRESFFIFGHPGAQDHRDGARILVGHGASAFKVVLIAIGFLGAGQVLRLAGGLSTLGFGLFRIHRRVQVLGDRAANLAVQPQGQ